VVPSAEVVRAFGCRELATGLDGGRSGAFRSGDVVLKTVADVAEAALEDPALAAQLPEWAARHQRTRDAWSSRW
jgi:hypothetical protein